MKMVRRGRRARAVLKADASFETAAVNSDGFINGDNDDNELPEHCIGSGSGVAYAALSAQLHENHQHFASPKRKDCKVDKQIAVGTHDVHVASENAAPNGDIKVKTTNAAATTTNRKTKLERHSGGDGKTIGVPLATRAQTRTIEIFFQAKAEQSAPTHVDNTLKQTANIQAHKAHDLETKPAEVAIKYLESGEDESNGTAYSDNTSVDNANALDFAGTNLNAYRDVSQASSFRSSTSDVENIFLQEPVLTLNVDKSPINAACCVKINKSLDSEPIFSSPPSSLATTQLNGRFSQIVTLQGSPLKQDMTTINCFDYKMNGFSNNNNIDNNYSVQQVMHDALTQQPAQLLSTPLAQAERKPTTPHRIVVCGSSPIKTKSLHDVAATMTTSPSKRNALHKELYYQSPRKSQRHNAAATAAPALTTTSSITTTTTTVTTNKTRRRLNQKGLDLYLAANCNSNEVTTTTNTITTTAKTTTIKYNKAQTEQITQTESQELVVLNGFSTTDIVEQIETEVRVTRQEEHEEFENVEQEQPQHAQQQAKPQLTYNAPKQQQLGGKLKAPQTQHHKALKGKAHTMAGNAQPLGLTNGNREMTEFFPIRRRSERKTKTAVKEEMMRNLEQAVLEERAEGMKVAYFEGKGRGVVADRRFKRGEFVVEYIGDLISIAEASEREKRYALDENAGCYMYYFKHKNQQYCIDATVDTGKFGRLVNHSRNGNLVTKVVVVKQRPHLVLIAKDDIEPGEELTYDYGDRSKLSLLHHPWLAF